MSSLVLSGVMAAIVAWIAITQQMTGKAQDTNRQQAPILARGFMDAPNSTAVVSADPGGGAVLNELRVTEGQQVKKGDIIAVLSNYGNAEFGVHRSEMDLKKLQLQRTALTTGYRAEQIALQELVVQTTRDSYKLKALEVVRSSLSPEMRQLDLSISQRTVEREELRLQVMKQSLAAELEQLDLTIKSTTGAIQNARHNRDLAVIRAPLDGVVVQIHTRPGERISPAGIVKIVDLSQIRVYADVDDIFLGRIDERKPVEIVIRGRPILYTGKVSRIAQAVRRMQRIDPDGGNSTDARVVQVEVEFDDLKDVPCVLGREVRVSFP